MIEVKESFIYQGGTYDTLKEIKESMNNELGEIVDKLTNDGSFTPKQRILLFDQIIKNKSDLTHTLDNLIYFDSFCIHRVEGK